MKNREDKFRFLLSAFMLLCCLTLSYFTVMDYAVYDLNKADFAVITSVVEATFVVFESAPVVASESSISQISTISENVSSIMININTADLALLNTLPGIGEVKAAAIIAYREDVKPFASIEEIMNVKGIGEATFAKLKAKITV